MTFEFDAILPCEFCDGFGSVDGDPYPTPDGPHYPTLRCTACDGTGHYTTHMRPVDLEDIEEMP